MDAEGFPRWRNLQAPLEYARTSHSCILYKHLLIIYGGENGGKWFADTLIYNLESSTWEKPVTGENPVGERYDFTACLYENSNRIIYFGGQSRGQRNKGAILDNIIIATVNDAKDGTKIEWEVVDLGKKTRLFRMSHIAHIYKENMYVFGGRGKDKKFCLEAWCLDKEFNWTQKKIHGDLFNTDRTKSAIYKQRVFMFGGNLGDGIKSGTNRFYVFDLETFEGKLLYILGAPIRRFGHTIEQVDGKLYVFGGCENNFCTNEVFSFDIEKEEWEAIKPAGDPPQRKGHHTCVTFKRSLIIFGGEQKSGSLNEMSILELGGEEKIEKGIIPLESRKTMFGDKKDSDVCFEVEGQGFHCHRNVLGARCKFFDSMFNSQMMESQAEKIEIPDVKASIFQELIRFIYCEEVELTEDNVIELLILADKYFLKDLRTICVEYLTKTLTLENFVSRGKVAEIYQIDSLRRAVVDFGSRNIAKIKESGTFGELSKSLLADIIYKLHDKVSIIERNLGISIS